MMMMMMITILGLSRERPSRTMAIKCVLIRFHSIRFHSSRLHSIRFDLFGPPLIGGRRGGGAYHAHIPHLAPYFFGASQVDSESAISSTFLGLSSVIIMQILLLFFLCLLCLLFFFLFASHGSWCVCVCVRVETKEVRNLSTAG